ncbi:7821_t:CDS:2 [Paraglomus brasilianum]|uniref:7821_t:CDS:1 n=1 Tax=Paraglomus brasilianum TaxID=144538 RepID=A0A9N8ZYG9_9GLOM|nr:7821_t:CDS:2 [Paraglomus brasilianum]
MASALPDIVLRQILSFVKEGPQVDYIEISRRLNYDFIDYQNYNDGLDTIRACLQVSRYWRAIGIPVYWNSPGFTHLPTFDTLMSFITQDDVKQSSGIQNINLFPFPVRQHITTPYPYYIRELDMYFLHAGIHQWLRETGVSDGIATPKYYILLQAILSMFSRYDVRLDSLAYPFVEFGTDDMKSWFAQASLRKVLLSSAFFLPPGNVLLLNACRKVEDFSIFYWQTRTHESTGNVTDDVVKFIKNQKRLQSIHIRGNTLTPYEINQLGKAIFSAGDTLRYIHFEHMAFNDFVWNGVEKCVKLEILTFTRCKDVVSIQPLIHAKLLKLKRVEVKETTGVPLRAWADRFNRRAKRIRHSM